MIRLQAPRPDGELARATRGYRCLVPAFDGAISSRKWKDALSAKFYAGAPTRQRQFRGDYQWSAVSPRPTDAVPCCRLRAKLRRLIGMDARILWRHRGPSSEPTSILTQDGLAEPLQDPVQQFSAVQRVVYAMNGSNRSRPRRRNGRRRGRWARGNRHAKSDTTMRDMQARTGMRLAHVTPRPFRLKVNGPLSTTNQNRIPNRQQRKSVVLDMRRQNLSGSCQTA
jgi:hypothetical protein